MLQTVLLSEAPAVGRPGARSVGKFAPARVGPSKVSRGRWGPVRAIAEDKPEPSTAVAEPVSPIDFDELTDLIKMVHSTDIVELELNSKRFNISVKKKEALVAALPSIQYVQQPPQPAYAAAPAPAAAAPPPPLPAPAAPAPAAAAPTPPPAAPAVVDGVEVTSPMSGTFYRSPAPGEGPFVNEGDHVTKGQTVCIIEAMKLMNEIEAEATGTIVKIVAENGKPVNPGQPLFIIKP